MIWNMNLLSKGAFSVGEIKDVKLGTSQVNKIFMGTSLVFEKVIDTVAPITTPRPIAGTYDSPQTIYLDVNKPSDTFYTTDGTEPTTASTQYVGAFVIDKTTTLKYFSVDKHGNRESVKTSQYTINVVTGIRYVRYIGHGDHTNMAVSRLVEFQAWQGTTNHLLNKLPISGEPVNAGGTIAMATNGQFNHGSNQYPIWWIGAGIPTLTYDLGATVPVDRIVIACYSLHPNDTRQTRFILQVSTDASNWDTVADYRTNTVVQPTTGFTFNL
jgi:hypothetical protein